MAMTPQSNATLEQIADELRSFDDIVICGHVSPDGDCIGSQLALWHALVSLGKRATCLLVKDEPIGESELLLPGADELVAAARFEGTARMFVGVDVPTRERVGEDACKLLDACERSITIDHHASETTMCDLVHVDPDAASASMLVWEVCKMLCDGEPPLESAICAYFGLLTDTGGFRYQNCDMHAFAVASELVRYGIDPARAASDAFQTRTVPSLKLESLVIDRMRFAAGGRVALSWILQDDMERIGAKKSDTEPLVDAVRSVLGVKVACLLREQDGKVRGSLRSKDDTDVSAVAREYGGGGHKAAAGFTLSVPMADAIDMLERRLRILVGEGEAEVS